ncbi:MAG: aldehyde dehydrogenase family protein, partial [Nitrospirae bacterium]|nr:aldehyde dehydrogenase family protein [Nitrospirota bacterium]
MTTRRAMLIAGRWVETGTTSPIRNPYNGEVLAEVCLAGEAEADEAIRAARSAFAVSRRLPAYKRAEALQKIAGDITARKEELARCLSAESSKPITDARREVGRAITTFIVASEEAKRISGE